MARLSPPCFHPQDRQHPDNDAPTFHRGLVLPTRSFRSGPFSSQAPPLHFTPPSSRCSVEPVRRGTAIEHSQTRQRKPDSIVAWHFDHLAESSPLTSGCAVPSRCAFARHLWHYHRIRYPWRDFILHHFLPFHCRSRHSPQELPMSDSWSLHHLSYLPTPLPSVCHPRFVPFTSLST